MVVYEFCILASPMLQTQTNRMHQVPGNRECFYDKRVEQSTIFTCDNDDY